MRKEVKLFLFLFTIILQFQALHGLTITEIQFQEDEFVEILIQNSSIVDSFNESYFRVEDNGNNSFSLNKSYPNASMILIVGSNFMDTYENNDSLNISNLNCQIYQTEGTEVGYSRLKEEGEEFTIHFNSNLSINYTNEYTTPDNEKNSLNFNSTTNFPAKNSPCELNEFQNASAIISNNISKNNTQQNSSNQQNSCNLELSLGVEEVIEKDKISFKFSGNTTLGVTYKVKDGVGNVVKNPFTSTTSSTKSYTPRKNGKFVVHGKIEHNNCTKQVNQSTFYYNPELDEDNDESSSSSVRVKRDTFIEIYQVIQNGHNQVKLIGEASRGDSSSYRMSVNVDDERVAEFDVGKYGNFDFQIPLILEPGEHEIELRGFGERVVVDVEIADVMSELEERLLTLSQMQANNNEVVFDENQMEKFIQTSDSTQSQLTTKQQDNNEYEQLNSTQINNASNEDDSTRTVFSQHFFSQNIGVLTMIGGIVLVAGAIIALR